MSLRTKTLVMLFLGCVFALLGLWQVLGVCIVTFLFAIVNIAIDIQEELKDE